MTSCKTNITKLDDLEKLSHQWVKEFEFPQIVLLEGGLGSGKSQAVRFMCLALGVPSEIIQSPSFSFIHQYSGGQNSANTSLKSKNQPAEKNNFPENPSPTKGNSKMFSTEGGLMIYHVDLFRLKRGESLEAKGFWDIFFEPCKVVFIEWPDRLQDPLPFWNTLLLSFQVEGEERFVTQNWKTNLQK